MTDKKAILIGSTLGIILGAAIALKAQGFVGKLNEVQVTTPTVFGESGNELSTQYKVRYWLDNSTCFLVFEDKDGKFLGVTNANKASCNTK